MKIEKMIVGSQQLYFKQMKVKMKTIAQRNLALTIFGLLYSLQGTEAVQLSRERVRGSRGLQTLESRDLDLGLAELGERTYLTIEGVDDGVEQNSKESQRRRRFAARQFSELISYQATDASIPVSTNSSPLNTSDGSNSTSSNSSVSTPGGTTTTTGDIFMFYCHELEQQSAQLEELELCRACNITTGMRLKSKYKNLWQPRLQLTQLELRIFNSQYEKLMALFIDVDMVFGVNADSMCFASSQMSGQYDVKKITEAFDGQGLHNRDLYFRGTDIIEPELFVLKKTISQQTKEVLDSDYYLKYTVQNPQVYSILVSEGDGQRKTFNFSIDTQIIDKRISDSKDILAHLMGNFTFSLGEEEEEDRIRELQLRFKYTLDMNKPSMNQTTLYLQPSYSQLNIEEFLEIFEIDENAYQNLSMPKGLSSINQLPVIEVALTFETPNLLTQAESFSYLKRAQVQYEIPFNYSLMPLIGLSDSSGSLLIDFVSKNQTTISLFQTGTTVLNKTSSFGVSLQKLHGQRNYQTQLRALDNSEIPLGYLSTTLFSSFNVKEQTFWPEDDHVSNYLINHKLDLKTRALQAPFAQVYWLPRLMQVWQGYTSIYHKSDARVNILIANLAGNTLQSTHLTWDRKHASEAFFESFNLANFSYYSELRAFEIHQTTLQLTNQDVDLELWNFVRQANQRQEDYLWIEGATLTLSLQLKSIDKLTDLFSQSFAKIFIKMLKGTDDIAPEDLQYDLKLLGNLIRKDKVRLEGRLNKNIELSKNVVLQDAKFIVEFDLNFSVSKKRSKYQKHERLETEQANGTSVDSFIEGIVRIQVEQGRYLNFFTKIDSSNEEWIVLDGQMTGLYTNVLGIQDLHLSQIKLHGQLDYSGKLRNVSIYGQGLFGSSCLGGKLGEKGGESLKSQDLLNLLDLVSQNSNNPQFSLNRVDHNMRILMETKINSQEQSILQIDESCFLCDIKYNIDLNSFQFSYLKGHLWVKSFKSLLGFVIKDQQKYYRVYKTLITPISELKFEDGIDFSFNPQSRPLKHQDTLLPPGFRFKGNIDFLGQRSHTVIDLGSQLKAVDSRMQSKTARSSQYLNINFELPSFAVGHQNIQVLSFKDFYLHLTPAEEARVTKEPIKVSVSLDINSEDSIADIDQISIIANVKAAEYITQAQLVVDDDELSFTTVGDAYPFNGIFPAQIAANIDIHRQEDISVAPATLNVTLRDTSEPFKQIRDLVDKLVFQSWILPVSTTILQYQRRLSELQQRMTLLKTDLCDVRSCVQQQSCLRDPIITCKEYKVIETCQETQKTCEDREFDMVCKKLERGIEIGQQEGGGGGGGAAVVKTDVCQQWSYECASKELSEEICTKSEFQLDFHNCVDFSIDCERGYVQDQYCLAKCQNTKNEYDNMVHSSGNFQIISDATQELFGAVHALAQTRNSTNELLIKITSIEICQELTRTLNPYEYEVTVHYIVVNQLDSPRKVTLTNFDFFYVDVAAERVALAIRRDLSLLYGLSPAFGEYIAVALENLDKFMMGKVRSNHTLTAKEIIDFVIQETQKQAESIDSLQTQRVIKIATPSSIQINQMYGGQGSGRDGRGRDSGEVTDRSKIEKSVMIKAQNNTGIEAIRYNMTFTNSIN